MENNKKPDRKLNRLKEYDYSQAGGYFVTICVNKRKCVLSKIPEDKHISDEVNFKLTRWGEIVKEHIEKINGIDKYVIMPNHIHLIVIKEENCKSTLSDDIKIFKSVTTRKIGQSIWQKSFYDHIIRNEKEYIEIQKYIEDNPAKWYFDELYEEFI